MKPAARRVDQILAGTPLAASLLARLSAARVAARLIAPICAELVPDFDPTWPGHCDLRGGVLRIWLGSGAHASKLRQASPRLLATLQSSGVEVSEIKIGVQLGRVRGAAPADAGKKTGNAPRSLRPRAKEKGQLIEMMEFSKKLALALPDSELRRAVDRLGRSLDARLARMRESDHSFEDDHGGHRDADP